MRKTTMFVAAAVATTVFAATAPSLFARGAVAGPNGGDITNPGSTSGAPPMGGGWTSGGGPTGNGPTSGPDVKRDGKEQEEIALSAVGRMARAEFRDFRDERNRRDAQPRRDGESR